MTLSGRIIAGIVAFTILLTVGAGYSGLTILQKVENGLLSLNARNATAAASSVLQSSEGQLSLHARTIGRDRAAITALIEKDTAKLKESLLSTFNRISAKGEMTDLIIYDAAGREVAALSTAEQQSKTAHTSTVVAKSVETGRRSFGIDTLPDKRVAANYVVPLLKGREKVGFALLALDLEAHLPMIATALGGTAILARPDSSARLHVQKIEAPVAQGLALTQLNRIGATAIAEMATIDASFGVLDIAEHSYVVSRETFGAHAQPKDVLFMMLDFTDQSLALSKTIQNAVIVLLLGALACLAAFLFWLNREFRPLRENALALSAASRDDPAPKVTATSRAKEIIELRTATDRLLQKYQNEARAAQEMAVVVRACAEGDFTKRLDVSDKDGTFAGLCENVNQISQSADTGLKAVSEALSHLSQGDLTHHMPENLPGVFGEIACSMNATTDSLNQIVTRISQSSTAIAEGSQEISGRTDQLAANAEGNAASVEETSAALEQMSEQVKSAAESAEEVGQSINTISGKAQTGSELMTTAVGAMQQIKEASATIGNMLTVIEDISFQTNLLALNAGVEAARAGKAGQGFAVVANEVRMLAQRSAAAAVEISSQVNHSAQTIDQGVETVQKSGAAFKEIVGLLHDSSSYIFEIVDATRDTSVGINEITGTTRRLDLSTQENANSVRATYEHTQQLQHQAVTLEATIGSFTVNPAAAGSGTQTYPHSTAA
ncbi:methyl-accepting chemotaxis protein [Shimia sp. R10_1]|uniref:methyl-accepting chemotaxis protein n=1 Tax=Shimia sp. R10_1 TaxID=2821095 RepID=UPI001ADB7894|nr:methyl-accepting chemotaxis protein [Shimia sp. R10_1]MBO9475476.1 methyl-accepting chemotaxis protein [Shimia sp. R10_1]